MNASATDPQTTSTGELLTDTWRATLGFLQLPTDLTLEEEGPALLARVPGVRLRLQKVELDGDGVDVETYESGRGRIARAAAALRPVGSLDVLAMACTSLTFTLGSEAVQAELRSGQPGARVTDMATAVLAALDHLGARRLALLTPYVDELHQRNLRFLREAGHEVVADRNLGLPTDLEITAISRASLMETALASDSPEADTLVLGCSAFRACGPGFLDELEERLGKPVVASQQALLWHALRLAGVEDAVGGHGSLFAGRSPSSPAATRVVADAAPVDLTDVYPSRCDSPGLVDRIDPVVDATGRFPGPLSAAQVDEFDRRGHLVLRQVLSPAEVQHVKQAVDGLRDEYEAMSYEGLDTSTDMRVITERGGTLVSGSDDQPVLKSIWQIHLPAEHAPHMRSAAELSRRVVCDSRLVDTARQLLGEEVYIHQSRINFQRGWSEHCQGGSGFLWHQDFEQWHSEDGMPRMRTVSMALLLERAVPANGALMVMPGSHRKMLQAFGDSGGDRYATGALSRGPEFPSRYLTEAADRHGIVHCRGEPGDVVLFDCNIIHGSHTNITPWGRCMFFAVYNVVSNTPAPEPYGIAVARPEHIGSHDPRWAGVPLPSLRQSLTPSILA